MELILISDSKLKVMMTADDMKQYEISCEMIDYDNGTPAETRRAFWKILDEAKMKTGFDASGDRVFVQVYPSKSGGCEMFVTKLGLFLDRSRDEKSKESRDVKEEKADIPIEYIKGTRAKKLKEKNKRITYMFGNIENLLRACSRLSESDYKGKSSVYTDSAAHEKYYIILDSETIPEFFCMGEYNGVSCPDSVSIYLKEYGKCICVSDAVNVLGMLV